MSLVENLVEPEIRKHVKEAVTEGGNYISNCGRLKPEDADRVGRGNGRCVFEKEGKIIKIAHSTEGIKQNKGAKKVEEHIEKYEDSFAMPIETSTEVVIKEKADTDVQKHYDEDNYAKIEGELIDKLDKVAEKDGVTCADVQAAPDNHGYIDGKGIVLTDLGKCTKLGNQYRY